YEVGSEVLSQFSGRAESGPGHVDLRAALAQQGQTLGLGGMTLSPWCSAHDRDHFFSHRASGGRDGRLIAYAGFPLACQPPPGGSITAGEAGVVGPALSSMVSDSVAESFR